KTRDKTQVVNELRPEFPLVRLLKAAGLARSTFYWQLASGKKPDQYAGDKRQILTLFHKHKGRYEYRRITLASRREGSLLNHKTVQRLMKESD
ncbi:IS3 family transposase, partial [Citrobacter rodentium]|uniref:IS3 family transposase n=1 Tax=Citrobacter rodentium TaxID=67825 RepID=UPI001A1A47CB